MALAEQGKSRGWQTTRTLTECHKYMFENQVECDVTLSFNKTSASGQSLKAHKYVLICRSPVFQAMFSGGFQEADNIISVDDIEQDVFKEILRYMYCDEVMLSGHNVLQVMYAAKKYLLDALANRCTQFLEKELSDHNVCSILNSCLLYDEKTLTAKSLALIASHKKSVFESEDFLELNQKSLYLILSADVSCTPGPMDTFNGCVRWAKHQQTSSQDKSIRDILGKCIYEFPFTSMVGKELVRELKSVPNLLTIEEENAILKFLFDPEPDREDGLIALGFKKQIRESKEPDLVLQSPIRYNSIESPQGGRWSVGKASPDAISFQVSRKIRFHGMTLFVGDKCGVSYSGHLELLKSKMKLCEHDFTMESTDTGESVCVTIPDPVTIEQGVMYTVRVGSDGPDTCFGTEGSSTVTNAGCTFTFSNASAKNNCTSVTTGQIPQIIYTMSE